MEDIIERLLELQQEINARARERTEQLAEEKTGEHNLGRAAEDILEEGRLEPLEKLDPAEDREAFLRALQREFDDEKLGELRRLADELSRSRQIFTEEGLRGMGGDQALRASEDDAEWLQDKLDSMEPLDDETDELMDLLVQLGSRVS